MTILLMTAVASRAEKSPLGITVALGYDSFVMCYKGLTECIVEVLFLAKTRMISLFINKDRPTRITGRVSTKAIIHFV